MSRILAIVHTISTTTDRNGNRYHAGTVTSTETGDSMAFRSLGGESYLRVMLNSLGFDHSMVYSVSSTCGKRELPDTGEYEHEARYKLWHLIPRCTDKLGGWLADIAKTCERAVEVENDGNAPQSYRDQWGRHESDALRKLAEACKTWGVQCDKPGVYPHLTIDGRDYTLTLETATPIAKAILSRKLPA
jgi:hypothetical protein